MRHFPTPRPLFAGLLAALGIGGLAVLAPAGSGSSSPSPEASSAAGGSCPGADVVPGSDNLALTSAATLCLINEQRRAAGIPVLHESRRLDSAAMAHSRDMVARDYFEHTAPGNVTYVHRIKASGYLAHSPGYDIGENLGIGSSSLATPASLVQAWMNSPEHRSNVLRRDYRDSGIGIVPAMPASFGSGGQGATYTQDFGRRNP